MWSAETREIRHFHLFAGLGGGARGFNRGVARVGRLRAQFRCIGGIDVVPAVMRDFEQLAGTRGTVLDLFDREQYTAFNGHAPPSNWREATPQDVQRAAGGERPHIVFLSAPCKGFSGLLSESKSLSVRYQALNRLALRGVWLMLEAWASDPPELVLFENVPRLASRGRALLDRITAMLRSYGYATAETMHDCGELGGLAESRRRLLLVAKHIEKVPPLLYEPAKRPLRGVGEVLQHLPVPDGRPGMHRVPALAWKTWVRLAFVRAGSDWRSLNELAVVDGRLRDYLIVPEMRRGVLGVRSWGEASGTVTGNARPGTGAFSVADPRFEESAKWTDGQAYGVRGWNEPTGTVTGKMAPGQGAYSVADPRHHGAPKHNNEFRIIPWDSNAMAVTGAHGSGQAVADPRGPQDVRLFGKYHCAGWAHPSRTVIAGDNNGAYAVADPRSGMALDRAAYLTGGHYGVVPWDAVSGAIGSSACHDNGRWSVADPRIAGPSTVDEASRGDMPAANDHLVARIMALDGSWHRPFTTLELAALQSLFDPTDPAEVAAFGLDGTSDSAHRERIGNAVPCDAAAAIASEMGRTLLLAWSGGTFALSAAPVWVRPLVAALSVASVGVDAGSAR
jgi:site-specific DNA-cytosine methylase